MEQLKEQLIYIINQSKLPAEAVYFVVKDLYRDVYDEFQSYKQAQLQQQASNEQKEEEA